MFSYAGFVLPRFCARSPGPTVRGDTCRSSYLTPLGRLTAGGRGTFTDTHQRIAQRVLAEHLAIAKRLRVNPQMVLRHAPGNVARWSMEFTPDQRPDWLAEWGRLLTGPIDPLIAAMTSGTDAGTHLRETSPFVGQLTFQERLEVLRYVDPELARTLETFAASWDQRFPAAAVLAQR